MRIQTLVYSEKFKRQFSKLPRVIQEKALQQLEIFEKTPFHPSLRLHKLSGILEGLWSISVNLKYRILIKFQHQGDAQLISIGTHAIYEK